MWPGSGRDGPGADGTDWTVRLGAMARLAVPFSGIRKGRFRTGGEETDDPATEIGAELAQERVQELCIRHEIALPKAARLLRQPEGPFHPDPLHPAWGPAGNSCDDVKAAPHGDRKLDA